MQLIMQLLVALVAMFVQNVAGEVFESRCSITDWNVTRAQDTGVFVLEVNCAGVQDSLRVNLNHCVGNKNGALVAWLDGDFSSSCDSCKKVNIPGSKYVSQMSCRCRDLTGKIAEHTIFPGEFFNITNGRLTCPTTNGIVLPPNPVVPPSSQLPHPPATHTPLTHPGPPKPRAISAELSLKNQTNGDRNFTSFCQDWTIFPVIKTRTRDSWLLSAACYNLNGQSIFTSIDLGWCFTVSKNQSHYLVPKHRGGSRSLPKMGNFCHNCELTDLGAGKAGMECDCNSHEPRHCDSSVIDLNNYIGVWDGQLTCAGRSNADDPDFPDPLDPPMHFSDSRDIASVKPNSTSGGVPNHFLDYCNSIWTWNNYTITTHCNYNATGPHGYTGLNLRTCFANHEGNIIPKKNGGLKNCGSCGSIVGGDVVGGPILWCHCRVWDDQTIYQWANVSLNDNIGVTDQNVLQCFGQAGSGPSDSVIAINSGSS